MGSEFQNTGGTTSTLYRPYFREDWDKYILFDLADWINGMAFRNIHFSPTGKPVIKIAEIKNGITGQTKFTKKEYDSTYYVTKGTMLFSWSGQPETSIDVFRWRGQEGWLNQHIFKVRPNDECFEPYFFYLLKYLKPNFVRIARNKQTTGLGHVTKKDLQNITVRIPPKHEQCAIAHILGTLDDKIELNRRMNQTLEAMARAIFKSWFVDFDPVCAKAEGRDPGLPEHILRLFPDSFEDSELGPIPKGWRVKPIGELLELAYGKGLPKKQRREGPFPVYGSGGINGFHNEFLVQGPGIIVGRKGTVGSVYWEEDSFFPIDTVFFVKLKSGLPMYWVFLKLSAMDIQKLGADSAVPGVNRNTVHAQKWIVPNALVLDLFQRITNCFLSQARENRREINTLSHLRDTLLPKLISGELRVPDAEKLVEGTV